MFAKCENLAIKIAARSNSMKMKKCREILPYEKDEVRDNIAGLWDVMMR